MTTNPSIRVVPELRAVHVERHRLGSPADLLYLGENYDLAGTALAPGIHKVSLAGALRRFASTTATTLEVPEPLWMRFWPKHVLLAAGFKVAGVLRGRPHRVVTYAMENNDIETLIGGRAGAPRWLVRVAATVIGITARGTIDRICFATEDARATYARLPGIRAVDQAVSLELPCPAAHRVGAQPKTCVFVGVLEERKGVRQLMEAWSAVEKLEPDARLVLVGPGPLQQEVAAWAAASPRTRHVLGRLPHARAATILQAGSVLVAPSIPDGRWKEQVGLPVKEALAAGLTVVTTRQTGLADWLADHGHEVVDHGVDRFAARLAFAIARALRAPLDREQVRASLPARDGRLCADAWLHGLEAGVAPTTSAPLSEVAA